jgi:glycosyltransferase involved in cell wall biosynthesis
MPRTSSDRPASPSIAYVLRSYPRLSQTFIVDEVRALEQLGVSICIFAITEPLEPIVQSEVGDVRAPVFYLDRQHRTHRSSLASNLGVAVRSPRRSLEALRFAAGSEESDRGYRVASRYRCFLYAVRLAALLEAHERRTGVSIRHLHAHFAHDPAFVALLTHLLTGIPYSFTAHARDLYQVPEPALVARAERASAVVTICRANVEYLASLLPTASAGRIKLIHNGLRLHEFPSRVHDNGASGPPLLLSVGRLVEKKGFVDLLAACRRLKDSGRPFRCRIIGDGPERGRLAGLARELDLGDRIALDGARSRREIMDLYRQADVFALTPFVTEDGDRDGIPTAILEAMASGVPVVTTAVAGIPEVVTPGVQGLVERPHDVEGIAASIATLLDDARMRRRLGSAGRRTVQQQFDVRNSAAELAALFGAARERERCAASI